MNQQFQMTNASIGDSDADAMCEASLNRFNRANSSIEIVYALDLQGFIKQLERRQERGM